jgi:protein disulfide-isomerase A1
MLISESQANDPPSSIEIQGFPTLKLFPGGAKDKPIDYEGDRSVEDMAKFVLENGKHKVDAYVAPPAEEAEEHEDSDEDMLGQFVDMMGDVKDAAEEVVVDAAEKAETVEEASKEAAEEVSFVLSLKDVLYIKC